MAITPGMKLGPYEIQSLLGAGGMGEVYRARDTRLQRTVAIKVLPEHLSSDFESKQRFEREARAISSLSHPHICALYDIGTQDGIDFLVMEYLEGRTLADRLQGGGLPVEEVLKTGIEIADALSCAHLNGIVHRDLKPGNIMLTPSGAKLLDFGLAKPGHGTVLSGGTAGASTLSQTLSEAGTIVGTFRYMAPEQLEGKHADARSDIFALGALLYEMTTGEPAFDGKTPASIVAAILTSEPQPVTALPAEMDRLIQTALVKNPEERWQSAHDVEIVLKGILATRRHRSVQGSRLRILQIAVGLLTLSTVILATLLPLYKSSQSPKLIRFTLGAPPNASFGSSEKVMAVSPNGREVAFTAVRENGPRSLWVRALDSLDAKELPGTDDADSPFWSPDGKLIGFFSHSKLKKVNPSGGEPEIICNAGTDPGGAAWNRDGVIVFAPNFEGVLYRVSASGGEPVAATETYKEREEANHVFPEFLPDGRHFLFLVLSKVDQGIHLGSLDSKEHHLIFRESSPAAYVEPGYLLFGRNGALMAQRFDWKHARAIGEPTRIIDRLEAASGFGYFFSVSTNGVLVYWTGRRYDSTQLTWYRRDGSPLGKLGPVGPFRVPRISPNGHTVAVDRFESEAKISVWLIDSRGVPTRFTFGDFDLSPIWAPNGASLIFSSPRDGLPPNPFEKALAGDSEERRITRSVIDSIATDWSRDGRYVVYMANELGTNWNVWALPRVGEGTPQPVLRSQFSETAPRLSPDGHWVAYVSDESGKWEVYVQTFLAEGAKWQISSNGGTQPQWSHDGKELFYVAEDQKLMASPVHLVSSQPPGTPKPLFQLHTPNDFILNTYDVAPDDQRFLVATLAEKGVSAPLTVVMNWMAALSMK